MYVQTLSALFAHSRVGFVALLIAAALSTSLYGLNPRPGVNAGADPTVFAASIAGMLLCTWLFAFGVLLGAAVSRLDPRVDAWRLPLARGVLRRCTLAAGVLLVALALLPALVRLPLAQAMWLLPCLAGAFASFLLAGLAITLVEGRRSLTVLGSLGFAGLLILWPRAVQSWGETLSQPAPSLRIALAAGGLLVLVICGHVAWRWAQAARSVPRRTQAQGQAGPHRGASLTNTAQQARIRFWQGIGTPGPALLDGLVMPAARVLTRREWLVAGGFALLVAAVNARQTTGSVLLVIWPVLASLGGAVYAQGSWVSPRALLLPGGLRREEMPWQLFWRVLRRSLLRCVAAALPTFFTLWLVAALPAPRLAALALALPGCWVLGSALAVDAIRRTTLWQRSLATCAPFLPVGLCAMAADAFGWAAADGPLVDWILWGLTTSALLSAVGLLWLQLTARSLRRLDAGRLTPLSHASAD